MVRAETVMLSAAEPATASREPSSNPKMPMGPTTANSIALLLVYDAEHKLLVVETEEGLELPFITPTGKESLLEAARRLAHDKFGLDAAAELVPDPIYQPKLTLAQRFNEGVWTFHYFAMRVTASLAPSAPNKWLGLSEIQSMLDENPNNLKGYRRGYTCFIPVGTLKANGLWAAPDDLPAQGVARAQAGAISEATAATYIGGKESVSEPTAPFLAVERAADRPGPETRPGALPEIVSQRSHSSTSASEPTQPESDGILVIDAETSEPYYNFTESYPRSTTAQPEHLGELRERCQRACAAVHWGAKTVKARQQQQSHLRASPSSRLRAAGQPTPADIDKHLQFELEVVNLGAPTYEESVGLEPTTEFHVMEQEVRVIVKSAGAVLAVPAGTDGACQGYMLPGGSVLPDETPVLAAARTLLRTTGLVPLPKAILAPQHHMSLTENRASPDQPERLVRITYFAIEEAQTAMSEGPYDLPNSSDAVMLDLAQLNMRRSDLHGSLEGHSSYFPLDALLILPDQPSARRAEGNKLYFLTLFILDTEGRIYVSQKSQQATQAGAPLRGLFYTETDLRVATDRLLNKSEFKASKNAPYLLPCCMVTPGLTHYFMVINHCDLERSPETPFYQRKAHSRTQPRLKLHPRKICDVLASTAKTLSDCPWYSILERYELEPYLRVQEIQAADKLKHAVHFFGLSRSDARKAFETNSVGFSMPTRRAFHAFDTLVSQVDCIVQPHLGTLMRPGWVATEGHCKGTNTDRMEIELTAGRDQDRVDTLWDTGASLDLVDTQIAKEYDLETRVLQFPRRILLANGSHASYRKEARVPLIVKDTKNNNVFLDMWCLMVDKLPAQVLIGLPTLVTRMGHCFLDHIRSLVMHDWREGRHTIHDEWAAAASEVHGSLANLFREPGSKAYPERVGSDVDITAPDCNHIDTRHAEIKFVIPDGNRLLFAKNGNMLELPGGTIRPEPGESLLAASKRMLRNLMGLKIDKEANVKVLNYMTSQEHRASDTETARWTTYYLEVLFEDMRFLTPGANRLPTYPRSHHVWCGQTESTPTMHIALTDLERDDVAAYLAQLRALHALRPVHLKEPPNDYDCFVASSQLDPERTLQEHAEFLSRYDAQLLAQTWLAIDSAAPEDEETPDPCDFPEVAAFAETDVKTAQEAFKTDFVKRLGNEAKDNPKVHELMLKKGLPVFVPTSWEGIKGVTFSINWKVGMPTYTKVRARPINQKLYPHALKEFKRLCTYMYEPHTGPIASPMVVAPKATSPFIRICGDYREINKWMEGSHYPIPDVPTLLAKITPEIKYFIDIDLTNAFHQIRLDDDTAGKLSIATQWAQIKPKFLPEGCKPASHQLQRTVSEIFRPLENDMILAFDNILLLAKSMEHAEHLLEQLLDICLDRNVILKLSKSNIIVTECTFFSFKITTTGIEMSDALYEEIEKIPFPDTMKRARSFVGQTVYYSSFIPNYSTLMAPLIDLTNAKFDWSNKEKVDNRRKAFAEYKAVLAQRMKLNHPDFSLPWTLRTDASSFGIGAVLFQTRTDTTTGEQRHEPLFFVSKKFSDAATRWSTIEQECYAIFYALQKLEWYLMFKPFVIETDHQNLKWLEQSNVAKLIRWRIYIQQFTTMVKHIPGTQNKTADWLSRMFIPKESEHLIAAIEEAKHQGPELPKHQANEQSDLLWCVAAAELITPSDVEGEGADATTTPRLDANPNEEPLSQLEILQHIHNARQGHKGVSATWRKLRDLYPGHNIPLDFVRQYIEECPVCQKFRAQRGKNFYAVPTKSIPATHLHSSIGVDLAHMEKDCGGNHYICVVVNHFSKLAHLFPIPNKEAITVAKCLVSYYAQYGLAETIRCDLGSEFIDEVIKNLHKAFGIDMRYSLVRRHESSGAERTIREIRDHLIKIVAEDEEFESWSDPNFLSVVQFLLNDTINSETGFKPHVLHYGSEAAVYHQLPLSLDPNTKEGADEYLKSLDSFFKRARERSSTHLLEVQRKRASSDSKVFTFYQPGDLILYDNRHLDHRNKSKDALWSGPYAVIEHLANNKITCRHCSLNTIHEFHPDSIKIYFGTLESAERVSRFDKQQALLKRVISHTGRIISVRDLRFTIEFMDGTVLSNRKLDDDLRSTAAFQDYAREHAYLERFIYTGQERASFLKSIEARPLPVNIKPGVTCYVDMHCYNRETPWYDSLALPEQPAKTYFAKATFVWYGKKFEGKHYDYDIILNVSNERIGVVSLWLHEFVKFELPTYGIAIDDEMLKLYPRILSS